MTSDDIASWKRQVREISDWLYEQDPTGATGGGSSPSDEYDGEATRILSGIQNAMSPDDCMQVVRDAFDETFGVPWTPSQKDAKWLLTFSDAEFRGETGGTGSPPRDAPVTADESVDDIETVLSKPLPLVPIAVGDDNHPNDLVTTHGPGGPFTEVADGDVEMGLSHPDGREVLRLRLRSDFVSAVLAVWRNDILIPFQIDPDEVEKLWLALHRRYSSVENPGRDLEYALWIGDLCEQALTERASVYFRSTK